MIKFSEFFDELLSKQQPLGDEFQKILNENMDQLYEVDTPKMKELQGEKG